MGPKPPAARGHQLGVLAAPAGRGHAGPALRVMSACFTNGTTAFRRRSSFQSLTCQCSSCTEPFLLSLAAGRWQTSRQGRCWWSSVATNTRSPQARLVMGALAVSAASARARPQWTPLDAWTRKLTRPLDHLVDPLKQRRRHRQAKGLGPLQVDSQPPSCLGSTPDSSHWDDDVTSAAARWRPWAEASLWTGAAFWQKMP